MDGWQIYAVTTCALFLKLFLVALVQAYYRLRYRMFVHAEDAAFFGNTAPVAQEHPQVIRAANVFRNDLENIPIFLFLILGAVQLQLAEGLLKGACLLFVLSRYGHMWFYLRPRQPWRNLCYVLGQAVMAVLVWHLLAAAFKS